MHNASKASVRNRVRVVMNIVWGLFLLSSTSTAFTIVKQDVAPSPAPSTCRDTDPSYLALGYLRCIDFESSVNSFLCDQIATAQEVCCSCGGGGPFLAPSPLPTPLSQAEQTRISGVLNNILDASGGCRHEGGDCTQFWPFLISAAHDYQVDASNERFAAYMATIMHETDLLRTFYVPEGGRAGAFHLARAYQIEACYQIPRLYEFMQVANSACSDPCTCNVVSLSSAVRSKEYAFIVAAWWAASGAEVALRTSHGCQDILEQVEEADVGTIHESCLATTQPNGNLPTLCNLTGFRLFSYCVYGSLGDEGIDQRISYYTTSKDGFFGELNTGGGGGTGGADSGNGKSDDGLSNLEVAIIAGVVTLVALILICLCCGRDTTHRPKSVKKNKITPKQAPSGSGKPGRVVVVPATAAAEPTRGGRRYEVAADYIRGSVRDRRERKHRPRSHSPPRTFDQSVDFRFQKPAKERSRRHQSDGEGDEEGRRRHRKQHRPRPERGDEEKRKRHRDHHSAGKRHRTDKH